MAYPKTYERTVDLIKSMDKNIKIVDLGCGNGQIIKKLRKLGFKNIDYYDIEDKFDGKVKIMDFNKELKFKNNSFDLVISTEVIEHLENKYLFFKEIKRILKPNGTFIFSTPNITNLPNRLVYFFKGKFIEFNENEQKEHINPFFIWQLPDFFKIETKTYNGGFIPLLRIPFIRNSLFGQAIIVKCKVKKISVP
jgi:SAM-dependent methyltransferase